MDFLLVTLNGRRLWENTYKLLRRLGSVNTSFSYLSEKIDFYICKGSALIPYIFYLRKAIEKNVWANNWIQNRDPG